MPKTILEIKTAANELNRRAKMGQVDERALFDTFNSLVNYLAAVTVAGEAAEPGSTAAQAAPKVRKPRAAKAAAAAASATPVPSETTAPVAPVATPAPDSAPKTIPTNIRVGKGVRVGSVPPPHSGVTVGSAPTNPAGQVTVGGRIVQK